MTTSEAWQSIHQHLASYFGPERAAVFLGTMTAYPLHAALREQFNLVPAAWIIGGPGTGKTEIGETIHSLYHLDPEQTYRFANQEQTATGDIIARLSAYSHAPYFLEAWRNAGPGFTDFIADSCDMGRITTGTYGTVHFRVNRASPPLITSLSPSPDRDLASRYLHFPITGISFASEEERQQSYKTLLSHRPHYHAIMASLIAQRKWESSTLRDTGSMERHLAAEHPSLPIRRRIQLAIAWASFATADETFSGTRSSAVSLAEWISENHAAFDNPRFSRA